MTARNLLHARIAGDLQALLEKRRREDQESPCPHGWPPSWRASCLECTEIALTGLRAKLDGEPRRFSHVEVTPDRVTETVRVAAGDSYEQFREFFGKVVRCTVRVDFWSDDWHDGMRARQYIGRVTSHHEGGVCLQPPIRGQGIDEKRAQCFPLTSDMKLDVLPGSLGDYI